MGIAAICFFFVGLIAIVYGLQARKKAALISETPTTRTDKIKTAGFYEVKGKVRCERPVSVPNWDTQCVWYHFKVEEKVEYRREGRRETRWRTVDSKSQSCPFQVEDKGGTIWVNPEGADLDGRCRSYDSHQTPGFLEMMFSSRRTLGTRVTANYLEVGDSVYVLGRVAREGQGLTFVKGGEAFIVSNKSEEQVLGSQETTTYLAIGGGIVSFIISFITFLTHMRGN